MQIDIAWFAGLAAFSAAVIMSLSRKLRLARAQEDKLARRLNRRRAVMELLQDGVVLVDHRDQVVFANAAAAALLGVKEVTSVATFAGGFNSGERSQRIVKGAVSDLAPHGRTLELTVAPTPDGGRLFVMRDQSQAAEVDNRRKDFVANASHEIQTPLAAIIGMLDLAIDSATNGLCTDDAPGSAFAELATLLARCQKNALGLSAMTKDLLSLSRAEDATWRPTPQAVNMREICREVIETLQEKAALKPLDLVFEASAGELIVDRTSLETILNNLVDNAISYTKEGKVLLNGIIAEGKRARFEVIDTGPGIPDEIMPRIFERFFRGDLAHNRQSGGTGLGLAIVRNLVTRLGGAISVSTSPETGTSFTVELPLSPVRRP